jgi:uncharacterized protein YndB with AHSA1/START domain
MKRLHVDARSHTTATPEVLWELLADSEGYSHWGPWSETGYETEGDPSTGGVGAVRRLRTGRRTFFERIEEVEPPHRMVYTVVKGIPVRNYRAEVILTPAGQGTDIRWFADWDRTLAGRLVHRKLCAAYPQIVNDLITAAESGPAGGPGPSAG